MKALDLRLADHIALVTGAANGIGYPGVNGTALSGSGARYKGHRTDYRVALDYRFSPELLVYASVATGFKGGGTNPRPFNAAQVIAFNPETLTSFENHLKENGADFNATKFHLGQALSIDPKTELSTDESANRLFTREYRPGFELPIPPA